MINGSLIVGYGVICYLTGRGIIVWRKNKNHQKVYLIDESISFLFVLYLLLVVSVTLFPLETRIDFNWENILYRINLIPIATVIQEIQLISSSYNGDSMFQAYLLLKNIGGNILLTVPLGILAPLLWNNIKEFKALLLLGFLMSVSIEFLQFFIILAGGQGRAVDVDDVIWNISGSIVGFYFYKLIIKLADKFDIKIIRICTTQGSSNDKEIKKTI